MEPLAEIRDGRRSRAAGALSLDDLRELAERNRLAIEDGLLRAIADEMAACGSADADIPGQVYERQLASDRGGRRAGGAYYTPPYLIDFVVARTIGRHAASRQGDNAPARVIDPACGGGAFLLAALRHGVPAECLLGVDRDPGAVAICRLALAIAGAVGARVRLGDSLLEEEEQVAGFDVVFGNPPWGQKGFRFPPAEAEALRRRYSCAVGVLDPFKLFVERGLELVRPGGRLGLVLPDIILLKDQQAVRDLLLDRCEIEWIAHAGRAFEGVNLDAVVISGRRTDGDVPRGHQVSIWRRLPEDWAAHPPPTWHLRQRTFSELPGHRLNIYLTERSLGLLRKLAELPRFGEGFEVHEGVHTGNSRAKLFLDHPVGEHCVKLVFGRDEIAPFELHWAGAWLNRDPSCLDRPAGDYANLGRPEWFEREKILVRRTGDRVIAAHDRHGYYCSNNLFVVIPRRGMTEGELCGSVALLNSRFMTWYYRTVNPRAGRLFAELKINHLIDFPLPVDVERLAGLRGEELEAAVAALLELSAEERAMVAGDFGR